jgi:hypothetical protein
MEILGSSFLNALFTATFVVIWSQVLKREFHGCTRPRWQGPFGSNPRALSTTSPAAATLARPFIKTMPIAPLAP